MQLASWTCNARQQLPLPTATCTGNHLRLRQKCTGIYMATEGNAFYCLLAHVALADLPLQSACFCQPSCYVQIKNPGKAAVIMFHKIPIFQLILCFQCARGAGSKWPFWLQQSVMNIIGQQQHLWSCTLTSAELHPAHPNIWACSKILLYFDAHFAGITKIVGDEPPIQAIVRFSSLLQGAL